VEAEGVAKPGKNGQVGGAVTIGVEPEAASTILAIIRVDMEQWCAPWRRQHGGRRESSLPGSATASGPSPKKRIKKMENARRIWDRCYTRKGKRCALRKIGVPRSGIIALLRCPN
jgi:hypothetical protein